MATSNMEYGAWSMAPPENSHGRQVSGKPQNGAPPRRGGSKIRLPETKELKDSRIRMGAQTFAGPFGTFQVVGKPDSNSQPTSIYGRDPPKHDGNASYSVPKTGRGGHIVTGNHSFHNGYSNKPHHNRDDRVQSYLKEIGSSKPTSRNIIPQDIMVSPTKKDDSIDFPNSPSSDQSTSPSSKNKKTQIGVKSVGGTYGNFMFAVKENQDNYFVLDQLSPPPSRSSELRPDFFVGVMDGHGLKGKEVSTFVKKHLPQEVMKHMKAEPTPEEALRKAYRNTHEDLSSFKSGIDCTESGSTAVTAIRKGEDLFVANVGDSRCILGREEKPGQLKAISLTQDHKPDREDERQRIIRAGGGVEPVRAFNGQYMGPHRVWAKKQLAGGLAMSRAIGDTTMQNYGVTSDPEVTRYKLGSGDKLLVLGSDGVWDHMSNEQVLEIARRNPDPRKASEAIVTQARKNWQKTNGAGGYIDDITAVVLKL